MTWVGRVSPHRLKLKHRLDLSYYLLISFCQNVYNGVTKNIWGVCGMWVNKTNNFNQHKNPPICHIFSKRKVGGG